jgi:hypothetical protein
VSRTPRAALLATAILVASCGDTCTWVDYTIPTPERVLLPAESVVKAQVISISRISEFAIEAELEVVEVLLRPEGPSGGELTEGRLVVRASDDPCWRRSGLVLAEDRVVLVVLDWWDRGRDESQWSAWPILVEKPDGSVEFLDDWAMLNERIGEILREPTVDGVLAEVSR